MDFIGNGCRRRAVLRISAKVDYAVRALVEVARGEGRPVKAHEIARAQGIPERFLGAVLTQLRRGGLVESRRGGDGGYWLARPSRDIHVADVIAAIDGEVIDVRAVPDARSETAAMWDHTARRVQALLTAVTIADLSTGIQPGSESPWG
jgi:Rrf2 family protein